MGSSTSRTRAKLKSFSERLRWSEPVGQSPPDRRYYHIKLSPKLNCPSGTSLAFVRSRLYAAKEVWRFMSKPTDLAMGALKRLARYLRDRPRVVLGFEYQSAEGLEAYTDTDWAGCIRTRKSTSGGCSSCGLLACKACPCITADARARHPEI